MLVLSRGRNQAFKIGEDVEVILLEVRGNRAKIGIVAPGTVKVLRSELPPDVKTAESPAAAQLRTCAVDEAAI